MSASHKVIRDEPKGKEQDAAHSELAEDEVGDQDPEGDSALFLWLVFSCCRLMDALARTVRESFHVILRTVVRSGFFGGLTFADDQTGARSLRGKQKEGRNKRNSAPSKSGIWER